MPSWSAVVVITVVVWGALFVVRLTGAPDVMANDQDHNASYVLDVLRNGDWIIQNDHLGDISSKPPLYTWLVALLSLPGDEVTRLTLYLPCALSLLGVAIIVARCAAHHFGAMAGLIGAVAFILSQSTAKHLALARTDALFTLGTAVTAVLAYRAWNRGFGWTWFWLAGALTTLTKGPLGVLLASLGLFAAFWEQRSGRPAPIRGWHLLGIGLFVTVTGAWFLAAYLEAGQPLIDTMIGHELIQHAFQGRDGRLPGEGLHKPTLDFLWRFLPWSVFTFVALWRVIRHPDPKTEQRRFERFLVC